LNTDTNANVLTADTHTAAPFTIHSHHERGLYKPTIAMLVEEKRRHYEEMCAIGATATRDQCCDGHNSLMNNTSCDFAIIRESGADVLSSLQYREQLYPVGTIQQEEKNRGSIAKPPKQGNTTRIFGDYEQLVSVISPEELSCEPNVLEHRNPKMTVTPSPSVIEEPTMVDGHGTVQAPPTTTRRFRALSTSSAMALITCSR
jgi:hypothetical protein